MLGKKIYWTTQKYIENYLQIKVPDIMVMLDTIDTVIAELVQKGFQKDKAIL